MKAIGGYKASKTVYCSICGRSHRRTATVLAYSGNAEEQANAKKWLSDRLRKEYTCRICQSIVKDL